MIKLIILCYIFFYVKIINFSTFIKIENFFKKYKKYFGLYIKFKEINIYKKEKKPKISIISPNYNRGRYILRFLRSILCQNFNDFEIIFVDDSSQDNSVKIIKDFKKKDKRIKLIINIINKGTFICRNLGVQYSLGEYVILPDPDDILSKNILNICYKCAIKYDYEIIKFNIYKCTNKELNFKKKISYFKNSPIYQPELSTYMFNENNIGSEMGENNINNKYIKREVYIKSLNFLSKFYLKMYITYYEDRMFNFIIYRTAKSFFFLKKIGYYYLRNSISITKNINKISYLKFKFIFIYLKLVFNYSKNTKNDKDMANIVFTDLFKFIIKNKSKIKKYSILCNNLINIYLNNTFITNENKFILKYIKNLIKKK